MPSKRTNDSVDRILEELNMQQAQAGLRTASPTIRSMRSCAASAFYRCLTSRCPRTHSPSRRETRWTTCCKSRCRSLRPPRHSRARIPRCSSLTRSRCSPTRGRPARRSSRCRRWTRPARRLSAGTLPAPASSRAFSVRWPPAAMPSRWTRARTSSSDSSEPRWPSCPMKTDACTSPARRNAACSA